MISASRFFAASNARTASKLARDGALATTRAFFSNWEEDIDPVLELKFSFCSSSLLQMRFSRKWVAALVILSAAGYFTASWLNNGTLLLSLQNGH
jgi:hypothetical protein